MLLVVELLLVLSVGVDLVDLEDHLKVIRLLTELGLVETHEHHRLVLVLELPLALFVPLEVIVLVHDNVLVLW